MKETILLIGHGSRNVAGNDEILHFGEHLRQRRPDWDLEICFIEFADALVPDGLARAAKRAQRVIAVPLILNAAGHVKMEVPAHLTEARQRFPHVNFVYARHLAANESILKILKRRVQRAMQSLDMPDPRTPSLILLGRGSSDRAANGEVAKMARWLMEETGHDLVDIAFTGITQPRLETVIQRHAKLGAMQTIIVPYYLFTGTLMERIQRQVAHAQTQYPHIRFAHTGYFGFEDEIYTLVEQRVAEARGLVAATMMECDGCKFREAAHAQGHGHHHHDRAQEPA